MQCRVNMKGTCQQVLPSPPPHLAETPFIDYWILFGGWVTSRATWWFHCSAFEQRPFTPICSRDRLTLLSCFLRHVYHFEQKPSGRVIIHRISVKLYLSTCLAQGCTGMVWMEFESIDELICASTQSNFMSSYSLGCMKNVEHCVIADGCRCASKMHCVLNGFSFGTLTHDKLTVRFLSKDYRISGYSGILSPVKLYYWIYHTEDYSLCYSQETDKWVLSS